MSYIDHKIIFSYIEIIYLNIFIICIYKMSNLNTKIKNDKVALERREECLIRLFWLED